MKHSIRKIENFLNKNKDKYLNEVESDNWADSDIQEASILHHKCLCVIDAFDKVNDLSLS